MKSYREAATFIFLLLLALSVRIGPVDGDTPPLIPEAHAAPVVAEQSNAAPVLEVEPAVRTLSLEVERAESTANEWILILDLDLDRGFRELRPTAGADSRLADPALRRRSS